MANFNEASHGGTLESQLVRDVLYTCQGIDGEAIKYDDRAESYVLKRSIGMPESTRDLLRCLCKLGVLFRRVRTYILRSQPSRAPQCGLVAQALCSSLQGHLTDYYRLLAILEGQAHEPVPAHKEHRQSEAVASHTYMSLLRLSVWLSEPMERMRILATALDSCQALQGGALAGAMHGQVQHGDPIVNTLLTSLLTDCSVPVMEAVQRWVLEGELRDPFGEFIVAANEGVDDDELWHRGYRLEESMRPGFIPSELAERIFRTGKSINFLRRCCMDNGWVSRTVGLAASAAGAVAQEKWKMETVSKHVKEAAARINTHLLQVLNDKYRFMEHCLAIKRYLLLGQGDFMQALMDGVGEELNKSSQDVSKFQLTGTLVLALNRSNAQYDDNDLQNRLQVKLLPPPTALAKGWDVFTLEYVVNPPLSAVFTEEALSKYQSIFNFLWRLKRGEHALSGAWTTLKDLERYGNRSKAEERKRRRAVSGTQEASAPPAGLRNVSGLRRKEGGGEGARGGEKTRESEGKVAPREEEVQLGELVRHCQALRQLMTHVFTNCQYYIMLEVVEASWAAFQDEAATAVDLDGLIAAHDKYVTAVMEKALLGVPCKELHEDLLGMVGSVLDFQTLTRLVRLHVAEVESKRAAENSGKRGKGEPQRVGDASQTTLSAKALGEFGSSVQNLSLRFSAHFKRFMAALLRQSVVDVHFLSFRLDYSEYFVRLDERIHGF